MEERSMGEHVEKKKLSGRKIASAICMVILFVFMGFMSWNMTHQDLESNTRNINFMGYRPVVVVSGSMEPAIQINSISILEYCDIDRIDVGDVVMYRHPSLNINITHRCIEKGEYASGETYLVVKGDANPVRDNIDITDDMVVGKLIKTYNEVVPYVNFVMLENGEYNTFAMLQIIILLAVVLTLICMVIYALWIILSAAYIITFGRKFLDYHKDVYNDNLVFLGMSRKVVNDVDVKRGDGLRLIIAKIIIAREMKVFEESVEDLRRAHKLASIVGGRKFRELGYKEMPMTMEEVDTRLDEIIESTEE